MQTLHKLRLEGDQLSLTAANAAGGLPADPRPAWLVVPDHRIGGSLATITSRLDVALPRLP